MIGSTRHWKRIPRPAHTLIGASLVTLSAALFTHGAYSEAELERLDQYEQEATISELARVERELSAAAERARRVAEEIRSGEGSRAAQMAGVATGSPGARIVNGVPTAGFFATGALLRGQSPDSAGSWCSGTLIGCSTFLTAAHCVDQDPTPGGYKVYLQHGGIFDVEAVTRHPDFDFPDADLAVIRLAEPVSGVAPIPLNDVGPLPTGSRGTIVGFGRTGGLAQDYGIKRVGQVQTAACQSGFSSTNLVCWDFESPVGLPGEDSNTCNADSGGPLFTVFDSTSVLAGVTSGGTQSTCLASDHSYDVNVFHYRDWVVETAAGDLSAEQCGALPSAGEAGVLVAAVDDELTATVTQRRYRLPIAGAASRMRIAMNAVDDGASDFNLYVMHEGEPSASQADCSRDGSGQYAVCDFATPAEGFWNILVERAAGSGMFQIVATVYP